MSPPVEDVEARYSLVAGEGDGAILGLAAGDTAGGAWELGYSAITEQATVIAYHLIEHGEIDTGLLVHSIRELDGFDGEEPVYRAESRHLRQWLDRASADASSPGEEPTTDGLARSVPVGIAMRRDPERLVAAVLQVETLFTSHAPSVMASVVAAAAAAASAFAQSGRDLIAGVAETVEVAVAELTGRRDLIEADFVSQAPESLRAVISQFGVDGGEDVLSALGAGQDAGPWDLMRAGLLLAAPVIDRPHLPLEQAARIGGSLLGAAVGGIIGARVGIRAWPWAFANDTWFAEIGRRLVRGPNEVGDLPIPYAVEQHLISGERRGFH